jgi:hypothetical protein
MWLCWQTSCWSGSAASSSADAMVRCFRVRTGVQITMPAPV